MSFAFRRLIRITNTLRPMSAFAKQNFEEFSYSAGKKDYGFSGQQQVDGLALFLARYPMSSSIPRNTTGDLPVYKEGNVMCVDQKDSIPTVFERLSHEGFLSAPVLDSNKNFIAMVDMLDLTKYTTELFKSERSEAWVDYWDKKSTFRQETVENILKAPLWRARYGPFDPYASCKPGFSILHGMGLLVKTGTHRVPVVNNEKKVVGIFTESMAISILRQNIDKLGPIRNLLVRDMRNHLKTRALCIKENDKSIDAFNMMVEKGVSGLAVVDNNGVLQSNISISDLRGIGSDGDKFSRLFRPVKTFKELNRAENPKLAPRTHYSQKDVPRKALYVTPDHSLEDVIMQMNDGNIHRIFVCSSESDRKNEPVPTNVISQKDVLQEILIQCGLISEQSWWENTI